MTAMGMRDQMGDTKLRVRRLLDLAGTTYADEAGIQLRNEPMPLFQLLALCMLASKPINADVATRAACAVFEAGIRTPDAVLTADRQSLIHAFGRAGYARYDESSATRLFEMATVVNDEYRGDLRNLALECGEDPSRTHRALQRFTGIGDTGAGIFLREVQDAWPWARPYFDERALATAGELGLPTAPEELSELAPRTTALLAAALVRVALNSDLLDHVLDLKE